MELDDSTMELDHLLESNGRPRSPDSDHEIDDEDHVEANLLSKASSLAEADRLQSFYEPAASYEGRHRYDPHFQWNEYDEKKLVRKIDIRICIYTCIMFFALQLDRSNISQALSDNMLDDLKLTTNEYNAGQSIFFTSFLLAEIPSQLLSKRLGPDIWIPVQMVTWSIVASLQSCLTGRWSFWITRAIIGMCEGGFIPTVVLYLGYWYTSTELPIRLSYFWVSKQTSDIISALLAYGILHLRGFLGIPGWRYLFGLEGMMTGVIGVLSFFYLPPSPTQTASRFRGAEGWFTPHQEKIVINRILRDDPTKGQMHNREAISLRMLWQCLTDYHVWPIYLLGLSWEMPKVPMANYFTLNLRAAGFSTFETNLLTIPANVGWIAGLLFWTRLSERLNERFLLATVSQIWVLPILIAMEVLPKARGHWTVWLLSSLLFCQPYIHAILVGLASRNSGSVRTRAVSAALYNMCIQGSNVIGAQIYRTDDAPLYYRGNKILILVTLYNFCLLLWTKWFYVSTNRARNERWMNMSREEKEKYLATTSVEGNKRLDFRFAH